MRGVGVEWVRTVETYRIKQFKAALKEALTTPESGPKVIIAMGECMLNRQRREKPLFIAAVQQGERRVRARFGVDPDGCTGDHSCIRLSGCPSLTVAPNRDPLREDPVAAVAQDCVGCGVCGEIAHAVILCPSFYRADLIHNAGSWERWWARAQFRVIAFLQRWSDRRRFARLA